MKILLSSILLLHFFVPMQAQQLQMQVLESKNWCLSQCDLAGDELTNTKMLYGDLENYALRRNATPSKLAFPLRIGIVQLGDDGYDKKREKVAMAVHNLNKAFTRASISFHVKDIELIQSDLKIENLSVDFYDPYNAFSAEHDLDSVISVYVFDHAEDFCETTETSISCGRKSGFSYILSAKTNNVALSTFDLDDQKIVAHEFGHFFGLYHTFEESQFGKDHPGGNECDQVGDRICDTPPDPGVVYEVYVNYSNCEMLGFAGIHGQEYKPLIENFMSYYKPCYLREYAFTLGQIEVLRSAAYSDLRRKFSKVSN